MVMKNIHDLTKSELIALMLHTVPDMPIDAEAECLSCGDNPDAVYYYVCDKCNEGLEE